jgi:hypothetical protein
MAVALILPIAGLWLNGLCRELRQIPPRRLTQTIEIEIYRKRED